jgi:asparagine synthetase B (glutamine-hydrolysing)
MNTIFQYPAYLGDRGKQKVLDYLQLLDPSQIDQAYQHLISLFDFRDTEFLYTSDFKAQLEAETNSDKEARQDYLHLVSSDNGHYLDRLLRLQFGHWLPDNMLLRQDKTGMANAIEGRVPYLDHELVEFAFRLPPHLKLRWLVGKYILRCLGKKLLPKQVTRRKKMPFYVPIENYFQQPIFREQMDEYLGESSIRKQGIFEPKTIRRLIDAMSRREFLHVKQVFSLMVLEMWFRTFVYI